MSAPIVEHAFMTLTRDAEGALHVAGHVGLGAARVFAQEVTRATGQRVVVVQTIADCRKDDAAYSVSTHVELP